MVYLDWALIFVLIAAIGFAMVFFLAGRPVLFAATIGATAVVFVTIQWLRR